MCQSILYVFRWLPPVSAKSSNDFKCMYDYLGATSYDSTPESPHAKVVSLVRINQNLRWEDCHQQEAKIVHKFGDKNDELLVIVQMQGIWVETLFTCAMNSSIKSPIQSVDQCSASHRREHSLNTCANQCSHVLDMGCEFKGWLDGWQSSRHIQSSQVKAVGKCKGVAKAPRDSMLSSIEAIHISCVSSNFLASP